MCVSCPAWAGLPWTVLLQAGSLFQQTRWACPICWRWVLACVAQQRVSCCLSIDVCMPDGCSVWMQASDSRLRVRRWRLVSAPSIPGLLSLDPNSDPTNVLSSLTMGTEVEVRKWC